MSERPTLEQIRSEDIDQLIEEFEVDPSFFVELEDEAREVFFEKLQRARPHSRYRFLTLLTELRNDVGFHLTKEQFGNLQLLKIGSIYKGFRSRATQRLNLVKHLLVLLDSSSGVDALSNGVDVTGESTTNTNNTTTTTNNNNNNNNNSSSSSNHTTNATSTLPLLTTNSTATLPSNSNSTSTSTSTTNEFSLPSAQSPLSDLLPATPSKSSLVMSFKEDRIHFTIADLIDPVNDVDDAALLADLKEYVASLSQEEQARYLDLASDEVKDNMIPAAQYIANTARFCDGDSLRVTVLVVGEAGIGKSCLVNEIFRNNLRSRCTEGVGGSSITQRLESKEVKYTRKVTDEERFSGIDRDDIDVTIEVIDTPGLSRVDMENPEKMTTLIDLINDRLTAGFCGQATTVHMVLWCVQGTAGRLPPVDELWIRQLGKLVPLVLVWTRAFLPNHIEEFRRWMNDRTQVPIELPFSAMIPVYARKEETSRGGTMPSFNMPLLGRTVGQIFNTETRAKMQQYRQQKNATTEADFERRRAWSYKVVLGAMASASLVAGSPIPYVDSIAVLAIQSAMVVEINRSYGVSLPKNVVNTMLYTIITGSSTMTLIGSTSLAGALILDFTADTLKLIPGLNIVGQLVSAGIAGGLTAALGVAFIRALERIVRSYPDLMDVPPDRIEQMLMEEAREQARLSLNDATKEVTSKAASNSE